MPEDLVGDGEALSGGDSGLLLQLNNNFLFSCWTHSGEELEI